MAFTTSPYTGRVERGRVKDRDKEEKREQEREKRQEKDGIEKEFDRERSLAGGAADVQVFKS